MYTMFERDETITSYPTTMVHKVAFAEPEEAVDPDGLKFPMPTGSQYSDEVFEEHLIRSGGGPEDMSLLHSMELIRWLHNDIMDELERLTDELESSRHSSIAGQVRKLHSRTRTSNRTVGNMMAHLGLSVSMTLNRKED
ncbi:MAG: hypothetical protein CMM29_10485 [Rhodospirillaceae bacterium]|nr:hypothetical protein [Rhodospirillaceae bacterium]MBR87204.1 hypothetical protein [Rhodospirillaceae bacterium]